MKFLNSLILLALLGVFFSCGDDDEMTTTDSFVGQWNLISLDYSGTSTTIDPDGESISIDFDGAAREIMTTVIFNADGTYTSQGSYIIDLTTDFYGYMQTTSVPFEGFVGNGTWELNGTTLTTTDTQTQDTATLTVNNLSDSSWDTNLTVTQNSMQQGFTIIQEVNGNYFFER
jgi:hypothetical protein